MSDIVDMDAFRKARDEARAKVKGGAPWLPNDAAVQRNVNRARLARAYADAVDRYHVALIAGVTQLAENSDDPEKLRLALDSALLAAWAISSELAKALDLVPKSEPRA